MNYTCSMGSKWGEENIQVSTSHYVHIDLSLAVNWPGALTKTSPIINST